MPLLSKPKELVVNVTREGQYRVGGRQLNSQELLEALRQAEANNPGRQKVIIYADRLCVWQHVVHVMDLCNQARIRDYVVDVLDDSA
jgi:biopolymer transport protein ExbD